MKRKLLLILALLIFIGTESWGQGFDPFGGDEVTVSLSPSSLTMTVGEEATVTCTISSAIVIGQAAVTWEVVEGAGNIFIIKEPKACQVTALQAGSATIQAEYDGKTATCSVTVNPLTLTAKEGATGEYWATYYNNKMNLTADDNTTVFQAALSGDQLTLTPVANRIIPYGDAVILKSSAETITLTPATTTQTLAGNMLQGTATSITNPGNAYVLNKTATNGVGFYKLSASGTIGANKAYLTYSGGAGAREFFLFDEATGIEAIDNGQLTIENVVYDLQGRRVSQPTKGLYIVNGKKVIIK